MAIFGRTSRALIQGYLHGSRNGRIQSFCTVVERPKSRTLLKASFIGAAVGITLGVGYSYKKISEVRKNLALEGTETENKKLKHKPPFQPSRQVISPVDTTGLKLTLFQYQTCPFCCKVRVFLDYYGLSYDVVEVDPVLRQQLSWSPYRKVPILLTNVEGGYKPLCDSSMIISLLTSFINDKSYKIEELADYYPMIHIRDDNDKIKPEIINKYFLMNKAAPSDKVLMNKNDERKWRKWADEVLVHVLSPNVYRTLDEAFRTFNWFSEIGKWEEYFPLWERMIIINIGATAMWLISKRLKKRHNLKPDVRQSLYDEVNYWLKEIRARGTPFMGGRNPNLSDLAVYGILKSIEGCDAFKDLLNNTDLSVWFSAMKEQVDNHAGSIYLRN